MSPYVNSYQPPDASIPPNTHSTTPAEEYDFNFNYPVSELRSSRVELRLFVPSIHAQLLFDMLRPNPKLLDYVPLNPVESVDDVLRFVESSRRAPERLMYAIYTGPLDPDTPCEPSKYEFAGVMSAVNSSVQDMTSELGFIMIAPKYQRTHVLSHAAGTLMHHILDSVEDGGWGCRRCQWFTNSMNEASAKAALRLGFKFEGILRQHRVLLVGKPGNRVGRPGPREEHRSRDSWLASITWEEWEGGVREHVDGLMARGN